MVGDAIVDLVEKYPGILIISLAFPQTIDIGPEKVAGSMGISEPVFPVHQALGFDPAKFLNIPGSHMKLSIGGSK
jgi:hypothetical protein